MLRWVGTRENRQIIGLGLEEKNLEKLRQDQPILVKGESIGMPFDILIYYGKDMDTLMEMTKQGVGPHTVIHDRR